MTTEKHIPLHILKEITNGFSAHSRIGRGGYGDVYKGVYNGKEIAVKLLHVDTVLGLDDRQYINEVGNLLRVKHPNIVQLLGYCYDIQNELIEHDGAIEFSQHIYRVLCFEYLQGGSLDKHLSAQSFAPNWSTRYNIIKGICEGLNFLHECKPQIWHLDVKPANILLDNSMEPKVADLGLSRLFTRSHTHVTETIIGSRKYMPPEFINEGRISPKNDVFSFGIVMIEIMTSPLGYSNSLELDDVAQFKQEVLTNWSIVIEATSNYRLEDLHQVKTCIGLAIRCVDSERDNRPTIADILDALNKTETHISKRQLLQLEDLPPSSTIGPKNTMANTLKTMAAELDIITNEKQHFRSVPDNTSIVQQGLRETASDVEESLIIGRSEEKQKIVAALCGSITSEIRGRFTNDPSPGLCLCIPIPFYHELNLLYTVFVSSLSKLINWSFGPTPQAETLVAQGIDPPRPDITILPIYGIGGIGKTTLAQLVFNDYQFAGHSRVWVYVSQNFDLDKIGNSIISQLSEVRHVTEKQVIYNHLRKLLAGKKILIVLDDLWEKNPDRIRNLKAMLRLGAGSMVTVIVTTRDEAIAREICHSVEPYKLDILTNKMCWTIIKQKTAFKDRVDKEQLKHIGREIATKCGGVALAAQSLGYTLNGKTSDEWEAVRDNYMWNLSTSEDPSSINQEVLASLLLSYSCMPDWLKLCFSYCAVFPKGHNILKYDLIHQWIALGFTEPSRIFDSMQLCEKYVKQLLGMSFLQYSKTSSSDGQQDKDVTLLTMHDLVHDLATAILGDQVNNKGKTGGNRWRYALLTNCSKALQFSVTSLANIKALHFLDSGKVVLRGYAFSLATCLQVLDLRQCFIPKLPDSVGQLKQLKFLRAPGIQDRMIPCCITELSELNYLNLRGSDKISALPESIGDMKGLMHLDLSGCLRIRELPLSFTELKQLVHLDLSDCYMPISEAFGGFTKLQYLNLSIRVATPMNRRGLSKVIGNLIKLRYLNLSRCMEVMISSKDQIGSLLGSISTLSNLEHLDLSWNPCLSSIPESIGNLRKLHTLDLSDCSHLEKLPNSMVSMVSLKVLNVKDCHGLDASELSWLNVASLPHFVVHASSDKCSSNIILLQPTNPVKLTIDRLENVKSAEEAHSIQLTEKQKIEELTFKWTVDAGRFVDDKEVLEKLVPPRSVWRLSIAGYSSVVIPNWLMDIRFYLPNLLEIDLHNFPKCKYLPPLGQLPNLQYLCLHDMESLEEWNTMTHSSGEEGVNEHMFPKLGTLRIMRCTNLRIKPCLPTAKSLYIVHCDNVLSSWGESSSHSSASSSSPVTIMNVKESKLPFHQWRCLHQLPALHSLSINSCSDLTTSREIIKHLSSLQSLTLEYQNQAELPSWLVELTSLQELKLSYCRSMTSLPQWLEELASLKKFQIWYCEGIRFLPDSIQQLTKLEYLQIRACPTLKEWCESEENKMKLAHIREVVFDRRRSGLPRASPMVSL